MALPLLTHLRSHFPESHITWICGAQVKPLLDATGLINQIISIDEKSIFKGNTFVKIWELLKVWIFLFAKKFDLCITGHQDPRYKWISFPAICKQRKSFSRKSGRLSPVPGRYHAYEYLRLLTGNDAPPDIPVIFPHLAIPGKKIVNDLILSFGAKPVVVIAPGGAKNALADDFQRRWPVASYASLMKKLSALPINLIVTGSQSDFWVSEHFQGIPHIDLLGKLDLLDLVCLLRASKLLITHDSGPLHLAKLADCSVIGLFGPTNPHEKVGRHEKIKVIWGGENLACRPCYDGKTYARCNSNICLANISIERVFSQALDSLGLTQEVNS